MLYISRCLGPNRWSVTDTDDGLTEEVFISDLDDALRSGVQIAGVELRSDAPYSMQQNPIARVKVYQNQKKLSGKMLKLKMLRGVDLCISGKSISQIRWDNPQYKSGFSLRVSDYCQLLGNYALLYEFSEQENVLVLVLDDKIKLAKNALVGAFDRNIQIDIREVTNKSTIEQVYDTAMHGSSAFDSIKVIDNKHRLDFWTVVSNIRTGYPVVDSKLVASVSSEIERMYRPILSKLFSTKVSVIDDLTHKNECNAYVLGLRYNAEFWRGRCKDFETVRKSAYRFFDDIWKFTTVRHADAMQAQRYMRIMELTPALKKSYVEFVNRVNVMMLDFGRSNGWSWG